MESALARKRDSRHRTTCTLKASTSKPTYRKGNCLNASLLLRLATSESICENQINDGIERELFLSEKCIRRDSSYPRSPRGKRQKSIYVPSPQQPPQVYNTSTHPHPTPPPPHLPSSHSYSQGDSYSGCLPNTPQNSE